MSKYNWAVFYDNKPKYNVGAPCIHGNGYVFGIIADIKSEPISEKDRKDTEELRKKQKNCCGRKGRGVREESNDIYYLIAGEWVYEGHIYVIGIESINKYISELRQSIDDYSERMERAASTLGYSNDY